MRNFYSLRILSTFEGQKFPKKKCFLTKNKVNLVFNVRFLGIQAVVKLYKLNNCGEKVTIKPYALNLYSLVRLISEL